MKHAPKPKHTPGHWFVEGTNQFPEINSTMLDPNRCPSEYRVCDVAEGENALANARLIVAAPELLEAIKEFLSCGPNAGHNLDLIERCKAAVARAEGGAE